MRCLQCGAVPRYLFSAQPYLARVLLAVGTLAFGPGCVWPQNRQPERATSGVMAPSDLERVREVLARRKQEILSKYQAVGVGIGKEDPSSPKHVVVVFTPWIAAR